MALGIYFSPASMLTSQYDEVLVRLKKAGQEHPRGRTYHACFGSDGALQVFDVWDSLATFEAFGQTLMPILGELGIDIGQPMVAEIHNVVVPAARKRKATPKAAPKKAPKKARKAAPRKNAARRRGKRR